MKIINEIIGRFPTIAFFSKKLKRDYSVMYLGSTEAFNYYQNASITNDDALYLCIPSQCLEMNYEVLRHFFSILRKDSRVVLCMSENELCANSKRVLPVHSFILRPELYPKTMICKLQMKFPLVFQPLWTLKCLGYRIPERIKGKNIKHSLPSLLCIKDFCINRDLNFEIEIIGEFKNENAELLRSNHLRVKKNLRY